jgi:hypothetical protein
MKTKKFPNKLVLKKRTIADLNSGEMKFIVGGEFTDANTCIACETEECPIEETQGCSGAANSCGVTCGVCNTWGVITCYYTACEPKTYCAPC